MQTNHDDEDMTYELSASFRTLDAYQKDAMRTRSAKTDLLYSAGKLSVEAGELLQHVLKMRYHAQQVQGEQGGFCICRILDDH